MLPPHAGVAESQDDDSLVCGALWQIGFSWGAAGTGTSVWKGVPLHEVLKRCGILTPDQGAHHVCFVGVEKMPKGRYGTSIDYFTAMNPAEDVLIAWEQNGEPLTPDHGFPLRLIIPGCANVATNTATSAATSAATSIATSITTSTTTSTATSIATSIAITTTTATTTVATIVSPHCGRVARRPCH